MCADDGRCAAACSRHALAALSTPFLLLLGLAVLLLTLLLLPGLAACRGPWLARAMATGHGTVPQLRGRTPHSSWGETGLQPGDMVTFAGEITMNIGYKQRGTVVQEEAHRPVQVHWG